MPCADKTTHLQRRHRPEPASRHIERSGCVAAGCHPHLPIWRCGDPTDSRRFAMCLCTLQRWVWPAWIHSWPICVTLQYSSQSLHICQACCRAYSWYMAIGRLHVK